MRSYSALFIAIITAAVAPVVSAAPAHLQVIRDVQNPGVPSLYDGGDNHVPPILPRGSMPDSDFFETTNQPDDRSTSAPTRSYSRRAPLDLSAASKFVGFFRDMMDEGVALDATASDAEHLHASKS